jgi:hypothetical protein
MEVPITQREPGWQGKSCVGAEAELLRVERSGTAACEQGRPSEDGAPTALLQASRHSESEA